MEEDPTKDNNDNYNYKTASVNPEVCEGSVLLPHDASSGEAHPLRAWGFPHPRAHMTGSLKLSRRSTATQDISMHSSDSIREQGPGSSIYGTSAATATADPFLTVIFPSKVGGEEEDEMNGGSDSMLSMWPRDNLGRAQVQVEGYFREEDGDVLAFIPNDLPRSTVLYVLTASEGRDKLFKFLQYGLHLMVCFLKRPSLFTEDSQKVADYWAERFWRNSNTIRHGRGLFKLGRWVLNIFYLEEVCSRLKMKHGAVVTKMLGSFTSSLFDLLHLPPKWRARLRQQQQQNGRKSFYRERSVDGAAAEAIDTLLTDDMYPYVARTEIPLFKPRSSLMMIRMNMEKNGGRCNNMDMARSVDTATTATRFHIKERIFNSTNNTTTGAAAAASDMERKVGGVQEQYNDISAGQTESNACEPLASSQTLPSTPPESMTFGDLSESREHSRKSSAKLLHPPCPTSCNDEENNDNNNDNESGCSMSKNSHSANLVAWDSSQKPMAMTDATRQFFTSYQTIPYEPQLGDTLPSPQINSSINNNRITLPYNAVKDPAGRVRSNRGTADDLENDEGGESGYYALNNSDANLTSSGEDEGKEKREEEERDNSSCLEQRVPAEMGNPEKWRKRLLQFSTPLMLLLAVRSIAAIGRRILRDVLLLSSEHFLNVACVERSRPSLQRHTNWMWFLVSSIDLFLNTIRLTNQGWYKYSSARYSTQYHCQCREQDMSDITWWGGVIARRNKNIYFPAVDFDFGAPICSTPVYFEAADPGHIAPACRACGCLFVESSSVAAADAFSQQQLQPQQQEGEEVGVGGKYYRAYTPSKRNREEVKSNQPSEYAQWNSRRPGLSASLREKAEVTGLLIPWLVRKMLNYVLLVRTHSNLTATILLQVRYMTEVYLSAMYCFGGYETGKSDASLNEILHTSGAIAGLLGAAIGLYRVVESAPK